jgi:hypothetical protein
MTDPRNMQEAEDNATELVSPELVLVDPQLASRARERLRVFGDDVAFQRRAVAPARQGPRDPGAISSDYVEDGARDRAAISPDHVESSSLSGSAHRRGRRVVAAASVMLAGAAVALFIVTQVSDIGGSVSARTETSVERITAHRTGPARQKEPGSERSRAPAKTVSRGSTKPPIESKKRPRSARRTDFPTRVFVWPAASRATFYKVEFFRRGRKIFEASPSQPRIELPLRWTYKGRRLRLTSATYRWEVRAAFGSRARPRFGKVITRSTWAPR